MNTKQAGTGVFRPLRLVQFLFIFFVFIALVLRQPVENHYIRFSGPTMGTIYRVHADFPDSPLLQSNVEQKLEELNNIFSVFRANSEISVFNANQSTAPIPVSTDLFMLLQTAQKISNITSGAYDITVNPLLELWGFRGGFNVTMPEKAEINHTLKSVGYHKLQLLENNYVQKKIANLQIDLGSIAKGYGVDVIANLLDHRGIKNYLVEIGGEIRAKGVSNSGEKWRIGINRPERTSALDDIFAVVELTDQSIATSGNYRNYIESDGKVWAHVIDPYIGEPVLSDVVSSTVIANDCFMADALATAALVSGKEKSLLLFAEFDVQWYLILRDAEQGLISLHSTSFLFSEVKK